MSTKPTDFCPRSNFRSSRDNLSWISALGTMLDAASLVPTTICEEPRDDAKLLKRVGTHLVEDISNVGFHVGTTASLARADFDAACDGLEEVGYSLEERDVTWPMFEAARATYADRLEGMAAHRFVPTTSWLGDPVALRTPIHPMEV